MMGDAASALPQWISGGGTVALAIVVFILQRDMARTLESIKAMIAVLVDRDKKAHHVDLAK
jgi:hypothetical protein